MKRTEKLERELLMVSNDLLVICHEHGCKMEKHPLVCCPHKTGFKEVALYSVCLGLKTSIRMIKKSGTLYSNWPQTLWLLKVLGLELLQARMFLIDVMDPKVVFTDLLDFASLYADDNVRTSIHKIGSVFGAMSVKR
jgi:hypothetical protein